MNLPLSASDVRQVADALDGVELLPALRHPVIGRIEVLRPDGDDVIGYFTQEGEGDDAWYGFVPTSDE